MIIFPDYLKRRKVIRRVMVTKPFKWTKDTTTVQNLKVGAQHLPQSETIFSVFFILSMDAFENTWAAILLKNDQSQGKLCWYASGQFKKKTS